VQFIEEALPDVSCERARARLFCTPAPDVCQSRLEDGEPLLERLRALLQADGGLLLLVPYLDLDQCPCRTYY
jgi:hypothetical protein